MNTTRCTRNCTSIMRVVHGAIVKKLLEYEGTREELFVWKYLWKFHFISISARWRNGDNEDEEKKLLVIPYSKEGEEIKEEKMDLPISWTPQTFSPFDGRG
mmetsp:Transcript_10236/g.14468  ORF Transcript_10236/g.14468 Transcript_10236/m.14468 type:complete len:101 (+) Transcript_10236:72-374(+)